MSCKEAMAAIVSSVEHGGAIPEEQREHLKSCARCRELLDSADQFDAAIHEEEVPEPKVDEARVVSVVRALRLREALRRSGVAAVIAVVVVGLLALLAGRVDGIDPMEVLVVIGVTLIVSIVPIMFFYLLVAALRDRRGNRIYKRLKPGRQVSGVCLGLSEATGVSVTVFRLLFLVLLFVKGIGLLLYIVLDLAMPVHPDDRQYLLRFKIRRAWQRRFGRKLAHADDDAR